MKNVKFEWDLCSSRMLRSVDITQCRRFGGSFSAPSSRVKHAIGFYETPANNNQINLRNIPEHRRSLLHRGGNLKSRNMQLQQFVGMRLLTLSHIYWDYLAETEKWLRNLTEPTNVGFLIRRHIVPPYSPRPADILKAKIDLGWVFLINSVSSLSEPRQKCPSVTKASHSYNICDIRFKFFPTTPYEIIALQADAFLVCCDQTEPTTLYVIHSIIHWVLCLTTGPEPLPKRALHTVWSTASSFKWE